MADQSTDVLQGTLDLLILRTLALEPMHGFGISRRIEQMSQGVFQVNPGSLLLAFRRLERDGFVTGTWRATDNNRRARYYRLTAAGRRRLQDETRDWERRVSAMARILEGS